MKLAKIICICLCGLSFWLDVGFAQMTSDEALSEFVAAGIGYKEGRYDMAISRYHKILDGGRVSGPLHYNMGNSYFKKKNYGKTILNYERARRYIPRDSDLIFNLTHVRSKIDQYGIDKSENFIDRAVKSFVQYYTVDEMVVILVSIVTLVGILFLISLYIQWSHSLSNALFALLMVGFLIFGAGLVNKVKYEQNLAIIMTKTDSYFEPRSDSTEHFKLSEGMKVRVLKSDLNWVKIERFDGKIGWVDRDVLEKI